ncbi:MAG: TonB-dependent receptor [Gammaproteobacteria bacterium]|nr:TonB-dependent receptor [Gammaproteobacteria bacterium]
MSSNKYSTRFAVRKALCVGALAAAVGLSPAAFGQQAADDEVLEEIITTGTRLARQDYQAASPIATVGADLFSDTGAPTIETVLNTLPQFVPAITSTSNNPSNGGQANVSLRGLGTSRTLVLLDGRRVVPSNPTGVVDLNLIPATLIENVEVITGGASAVYGSDAVAGVVNIKTRNFVGLELTANYGETSEGDGQRTSFGLTGGMESDDGRGYAYGTFNWADREEVLQGDRDFSAVSLDWDGDSFEPLGSSTIRQGRWDAIGSNAPTQAAIDAYFGALVPGYVDGSVTPTRNFGFNPDGSIFATAPVVNFTGDVNEPLQPVNFANYSYNFAPPNYLELPLTRKSFFGKAGFEFNEDTEVFAQALWANYTVDSALAATPATSLYVRPDNPNLDPDVQALLATRPDAAAPFRMRKRMIEAGPRLRSVEYDVAQITMGMTGKLPGDTGWTWDAYASWGNVKSTETQQGNVSRSAWYELALAPDHGASVCGSAINPFGINSIQPECTDFVTRSAINTETIDQAVIEAFVRGDMFEMPAGPSQAAFGMMYKNDDYAFLPDAVLTGRTTDPFTGSDIVDIVGFNAQLPVRGRTDSTEFYGEASFPLLASLDLMAGARYADHSAAGDMTSYKVEGIWDISDNFTLRGGYQRALRAPNISELFRPATINFPSVGLGDPCSNDFDDPDGNVLGAQQDPRARALCVVQGIPDGVIDAYVFTNTQFQGLSGGNPLLTEETADTYTVGLVFNFDFGFQGSIDYYEIAIEDGVGSIDADVFVERCFDTRFNPDFSADNFYCNFFQRDVGTGTIIEALEVDTNIAETELKGIDFQLEYGTEIGAGEFDVKFMATNLLNWKQAQITGEALEEFAGTASSSFDVLPEWKTTTSFAFSWAGFDTNLRWRYVDATTDLSYPDFKLDSVNYLDLTFGYAFEGNSLEGLRLRAGITNLTDEDPVIYPSNQQSNTDPSTYDVLGRRYFVAATYTFD